MVYDHNVVRGIRMGACRGERLLQGLDAGMELAMKVLGPVFVVAAIVLTCLCGWVFLDAVFGQVRLLSTTVVSLHYCS
jgi:hypothetical protein